MPEEGIRLLKGLLLAGGTVTAAVVIAGCDSFFRVHGDIVVDGVDKPTCDLRVHTSPDGAVRERVRVHGPFAEAFPTSWFPQNYYVSVACDEAADSYRSTVLRVGFGRYFDPPFELGHVALKGKNGKASSGR